MRGSSFLKKSARLLVKGDHVTGTTFRWLGYVFVVFGVPWLFSRPVTVPLWPLVVGGVGIGWLSWVLSKAWIESGEAELHVEEQLEADLNFGMFRLRVKNVGFGAAEPVATADCFDTNGHRLGSAFPINLQWTHDQKRIEGYGAEATVGVAYTRTLTGSVGIFHVAGENINLDTDIKSRGVIFITIAVRANERSKPIERHFRVEPNETMPLRIRVTRVKDVPGRAGKV